jgi:hypothetical protein
MDTTIPIASYFRHNRLFFFFYFPWTREPNMIFVLVFLRKNLQTKFTRIVGHDYYMVPHTNFLNNFLWALFAPPALSYDIFAGILFRNPIDESVAP